MEDEIAARLESRVPARIALVGPCGRGKTVALRHLASVFGGEPRLVLADEDAPEGVERAARDGMVVVRALSQRSAAHVPFALLPWTDDDVIEYLLAEHPGEIQRVVPAWRASGPHHDLLQWPIICVRVLERMVAGEAEDLWAGLRHVLDEVFTDPEARAEAAAFACTQTRHSESGRRATPGKGLAPVLLRSESVREWLAAETLLDHLECAPESHDLLWEWRPGLLAAVRRLLDDDPARLASLGEVVDSRRLRQRRTAHSVMCAMGPGHRPPRRLVGSLCRAWLERIDLRGLRVRADFDGANLRGADLREARFESCRMVGAELDATTQVGGAAFVGLHAPHLDASGLDAAGVSMRGAKLDHADFERAHLHKADLTGASLRFANLGGADLGSATLRRVDFTLARLAGADLRYTDLRHAALLSVDLRTTALDEADLSLASVVRCNLSETAATGLRGIGALFRDSDLTACRWRGAALAGARFDRASMADVDLRGSDLRHARFCGVTFHMGSSRSGLVGSTIAGEGSRTGFYTDESLEDHFLAPEQVRKANLRDCDLRGALVEGVDFYLVDLRGARLDPQQRAWLRRCRAILDDR